MGQKRIALTVSLPPDMAREFETMAKKQSKNKSQLFREMIQSYQKVRIEEEFFEIQRYGARRARGKGILTEKDVEKIVFKGR